MTAEQSPTVGSSAQKSFAFQKRKIPGARAIVETEIENMLNGKESAEDAVSKMASDMNKSIEDYNLLNE